MIFGGNINDKPIIIQDDDIYLTYFRSNHDEWTPDYFNTKVILYLYSGQSGSLSILDYQSVFVLRTTNLKRPLIRSTFYTVPRLE
jgi:hypothetical protein